MYCANCGTKLEEGTKFCGACGTPVEEGNPSVDLGNDIPNDVPVEAPVAAPLKRKSILATTKAKVTFAIIAALIIVVGYFSVGMAKNLIIRSNPVNWTLYGFNNMLKAKAMDSTTNMKIVFNQVPNDEESQKIKQMAEDFSIRMNSKRDNASNRAYVDMQVLYKNQAFLTGSLYLDKDVVTVNFPELYDKAIYLNWDEVNELISQNSKSANVNTKDYMQLFKIENSKYYSSIKKDYYKFAVDNFKTSLEKGDKVKVTINDGDKTKSINCSELILSMDNRKLAQIFVNLFAKVADDSNIKGLAKEKVQEFFKIAEKNGDLQKMNISKSEADKAVSEFDKNYDLLMKEFKNMGGLEQAMSALDMNSKIHFRFDTGNKIRGIYAETSCAVKEGRDNIEFTVVTDTVVNSIGDKVSISKPETSKAVNAAKAGSNEMQDIFYDIEDNFSRIIESKFNN